MMKSRNSITPTNWDGLSVDFVSIASKVAKNRDGVSNVVKRILVRFAVVSALQLGDVLLIAEQQVAETVDGSASVRSINGAPRRAEFESTASGSDG